MVKWLLDKGADPNETDESGDAALIDGAATGDAECVRLLLAAGADVHYCQYSNRRFIRPAVWRSCGY